MHRLHGAVVLILLAAPVTAPPSVPAGETRWNPATPDPALDTIALRVEAPIGMKACLGGVELDPWLKGGTSCTLLMRPGTYLARGQLAGYACLTTKLKVEAGSDTLCLTLPTPPDLRGRWIGGFEERHGECLITAVPCEGPQCADDEPPFCGIGGTAQWDNGPHAFSGVSYDPCTRRLSMVLAPLPGYFDATRVVVGTVSEDGRKIKGTFTTVYPGAAPDTTGEEQHFVMGRVGN